MKNFIYLIIIVLYSGCVPQKYYLTSNPNKINSYQTKKYDDDGIIFTPKTEYHFQQKVVLIPQELLSEKLLNKTMILIQDKEYKELRKYLKTIDDSNKYLPIAKGLSEIFRGDYINGLANLKNNKLKVVQHIVDLLMIDCEYEMAKRADIDINYQEFLMKYQEVLDKHELNDYYKEIINTRVKLIRYKM